jgi:hypothetical protein
VNLVKVLSKPLSKLFVLITPRDDIQKVLNEGSYRVIYFLPGNYYIRETLEINKPVSLKGIGQAVIKSNAKNHLVKVSANNVSIQNISFMNENFSSVGCGIFAYKVNSLILENVNINDTIKTGITINESSNIDLKRIGIMNSNNGFGLSFSNTANVKLGHIITSKNKLGGIAIYTVDNRNMSSHSYSFKKLFCYEKNPIMYHAPTDLMDDLIESISMCNNLKEIDRTPKQNLYGEHVGEYISYVFK